MSLHTVQPRPPGQLNPERHSLVVARRVAVAVRLYGKHAGGRCMVIDEMDWTRVRLVLGERWNIGRVGSAEYVVAYGGKAAKLTPGNQPLILARWLTWAESTDAVLYRNRDPLNLSRGNLEVIAKRDLPERMRSRRGSSGLNDLAILSGQPWVNPTAHTYELDERGRCASGVSICGSRNVSLRPCGE